MGSLGRELNFSKFELFTTVKSLNESRISKIISKFNLGIHRRSAIQVAKFTETSDRLAQINPTWPYLLYVSVYSFLNLHTTLSVHVSENWSSYSLSSTIWSVILLSKSEEKKQLFHTLGSTTYIFIIYYGTADYCSRGLWPNIDTIKTLSTKPLQRPATKCQTPPLTLHPFHWISFEWFISLQHCVNQVDCTIQILARGSFHTTKYIK